MPFRAIVSGYYEELFELLGIERAYTWIYYALSELEPAELESADLEPLEELVDIFLINPSTKQLLRFSPQVDPDPEVE